MSGEDKDTMPSDSLDGKVVLRIIMTGREAGSIIGKGGEIVKKFRAESGANIQVWQIQLHNHLNTGLVWYLNGRFVFVCQMVRYSNVDLKTGLKKHVFGPKCLVFKWSANQVTLPLYMLLKTPDKHNLCCQRVARACK